MSADNAKVTITPAQAALNASLRTVLAVATTTAVAFTSGCSNMYSPSVDHTPTTGSAIQGTVHGGQSPISGSTIRVARRGINRV